MKTPFQNIALIGKHKAPEITRPLLGLADFLQQQGLQVSIDSLTDAHLGKHSFQVLTLEQMTEQVDVVIVMGGDGTMLNIGRTFAPYQIPLIGINLGRLGFLTDLSVENMEQTLLTMLAGNYIMEQRLLLAADVMCNETQIFSGLAFNEVLLHRCNIGSLIEFEVRVNDEYLYTQRGDGLIVSTPSGSTAYAMSAGGSIIHPALDVITLVPICPHTLSNRPIVLDGQSQLSILPKRAEGARVRFDSHATHDMSDGETINVRPLDKRLCLLHPQGHSYYHTLREKLQWNRSY